MTVKNKSTLGTPNFIKEYHKDCLSGISTGWWNERFARKGERINITYNDKVLPTVYDLINYIKDNSQDISEEEIISISDSVYQAYPSLAFKRAYFWEVDESNLGVEEDKEEVTEEQSIPEEDLKEETLEEETPEQEKPIPDFEYAKTIDDKQELKAYAKQFGFKLDSRKSQSDMIKSFQGKYYSTMHKK